MSSLFKVSQVPETRIGLCASKLHARVANDDIS